jgi:exonuclease SbcC
MIRSLRSEIDTITRDMSSNNNSINKLTDENNKIRTEWVEINSRTLQIDEKQFICPTCNRPLEGSSIDTIRTTLTDNFNKDKISKLTNISEKGESNKSRIESLTKSNDMFEKAKEGFEGQIETINTEIFNLKIKKKEIEDQAEPESAEVAEIKKKIAEFIIPAAPAVDNEELKLQRIQITSERDSLKNRLATKDQIQKLNDRIA